MLRCVKIELWKSFHNNLFYSSIIIGIIFSITNSIHNARVVNEYTKIIINSIEQNYSLSTSYEGFSLFTSWLAVNSASIGSNLYNMLWPILASMPFGSSYSADRSSGYFNQIICRVNSKHYYIAKYIAVYISGGIAIFIPCLFDLLINALICPVCTPDVTTSILPIFNMSFISELYYTQPWIHALTWCILKFIWGGIAASTCWLVGSKCRFQTIVILVPFATFMLLDISSSLFCDLTNQAKPFSPMLLFQTASTAPNSGITIFTVIGAILLATLYFGYRQVIKNEFI